MLTLAGISELCALAQFNSIFCDFSAYTSFYACTRIQSEKAEIAVIIVHLTLNCSVKTSLRTGGT